MFDELKKYKTNDHFFVSPDQPIEETCNAPEDQQGVYIIHRLARGRVDIVYIGWSGKEESDGRYTLDDQGLYGAIVKGELLGSPRKEILPRILKQNNIDALDIYWYVTSNKKVQDLPFFVAGLILQRYFEIYGGLPEWNE